VVIVETSPGPEKKRRKKKKQSHSKQRLLLECCDDDKWEIVPNDIGVEKFISPLQNFLRQVGPQKNATPTHESVRKTKTTRRNLQATNPKLIYSDSPHARKLGAMDKFRVFFQWPIVAYLMGLWVLDLFPVPLAVRHSPPPRPLFF
jgi:hypothetical protein